MRCRRPHRDPVADTSVRAVRLLTELESGCVTPTPSSAISPPLDHCTGLSGSSSSPSVTVASTPWSASVPEQLQFLLADLRDLEKLEEVRQRQLAACPRVVRELLRENPRHGREPRIRGLLEQLVGDLPVRLELCEDLVPRHRDGPPRADSRSARLGSTCAGPRPEAERARDPLIFEPCAGSSRRARSPPPGGYAPRARQGRGPQRARSAAPRVASTFLAPSCRWSGRSRPPVDRTLPRIGQDGHGGSGGPLPRIGSVSRPGLLRPAMGGPSPVSGELTPGVRGCRPAASPPRCDVGTVPRPSSSRQAADEVPYVRVLRSLPSVWLQHWACVLRTPWCVGRGDCEGVKRAAPPVKRIAKLAGRVLVTRRSVAGGERTGQRRDDRLPVVRFRYSLRLDAQRLPVARRALNQPL